MYFDGAKRDKKLIKFKWNSCRRKGKNKKANVVKKHPQKSVSILSPTKILFKMNKRHAKEPRRFWLICNINFVAHIDRVHLIILVLNVRIKSAKAA